MLEIMNEVDNKNKENCPWFGCNPTNKQQNVLTDLFSLKIHDEIP